LQVLIELPLNLQVIAPAHQPNWDLVSEMVSSNYSRFYRSPAECKKRFETVILKREENCLTELQNKKQQQLLQQQQQQQSNQKIKQIPKTAVSSNKLFYEFVAFNIYLKRIKNKYKIGKPLQNKNTSHESTVYSR
jgi:hypothetical protein